MTELKLSQTLSFPVDAVTQKFAILGTSGSGKSYTAMKLAELMLDAGAQIIAVDPVGIWWSLRLGADGKAEGYKQVVVFGGDNGDLPLTPDSGKLVARMLAERGIPAVLDVSQFLIGETARFCRDFAEEFFECKKRNHGPVHLFLEECQTVVPEDPQRDEAVMLARWDRLLKIGRNYGCGFSMISQRPQAVNKKVLNLAETLIALRTLGAHERAAIIRWVKDVVESETDLVKKLPTFPTGTAHIWSPFWLKVSADVAIAKRTTFDASKTPEVGAHTLKPRPLTRIDVEQFKSAMAELIEEVKRDDPKELRRQISELQREITKKPAQPPAAIEKIDPAKLRKLVNDEVEQVIRNFVRPQIVAGLGRRIDATIKKMEFLLGDLKQDRAVLDEGDHWNLKALSSECEKALPGIVTTAKPFATELSRALATKLDREIVAAAKADSNLSRPQLNILAALSRFEAIDRFDIPKTWVAVLAGASATSSSFGNNLGALRTHGLIEYRIAGTVTLTDLGRAHAPQVERPSDSREMLSFCAAMLSNPQARILGLLHERYPQALSKEELADLAEVSAASSSYGNNLGALRSAGMVVYPQSGMVQCADWLHI